MTLITGIGNLTESGTGITVDITSLGTQIGDRLYFYWQCDLGGAQTVTGPAGATVLLTPVGADARMGIWSLDVTSAPATSYSVSNDLAAAPHSMIVMRANLEGGTFVSDTLVARTFATGTSLASATATNAGDESTLMMMFGNDDNVNITTPPPEMTQVDYQNGLAQELVGYREYNFATGTRTIVWSASGDMQSAGVVLRVIPAAGGLPAGVRQFLLESY